MGLVWQLVSVLLLLAALAAWAYVYLFNHKAIRNYAHALAMFVDRTNALIDRANAKGARLARLDGPLGPEPAQSAAHAGAKEPGGAHAPLQRALGPAHVIVGTVFSLVVAASIVVVLLFMAQLCGYSGGDIRIFECVVALVVVLVTVVQPLCVVGLYVNQRYFGSPLALAPLPVALVIRNVATVLGFGLWLLALARFGSLAGHLAPVLEHLFVKRKTVEIVLAGVTTTAALLGVACALTPLQEFWARHRPQADGQLNELIVLHNSTAMLLRKRQADLRAVQQAATGTTYAQPLAVRLLKGSGRKLLNRVQSFTTIPGLAGDNEELELALEVRTLAALRELIYGDVVLELLRRESSRPARRWGRLVAWFNMAFAGYCIYRVANVLLLRLPYYFWADRNDRSLHTKDALAVTIAHLIQTAFGLLPLSEEQLVNQTTFVLAGLLFVCLFQNVVVTFKSVSRYLPTPATEVSANVKVWLKNLVISECLAIYVVATALLMRTNLPPELAAKILQVLSLLLVLLADPGRALPQMLAEVDFVDTWFDKVFALASIITVVVIGLKTWIESDTIYGNGYDEEAFLEPSFKMS